MMMGGHGCFVPLLGYILLGAFDLRALSRFLAMNLIPNIFAAPMSPPKPYPIIKMCTADKCQLTELSMQGEPASAYDSASWIRMPAWWRSAW